jgi:hypothetical protein
MAEMRLAPPDDAAVNSSIQANNTASVLDAHAITTACTSRGKPERCHLVREGMELHRQLQQSNEVPQKLFEQWWLGEDNFDALMEFMKDKFSSVEVLERHEELVRFRMGVVNADGSALHLADVFETIEGSKTRLNVQEYSVTQTSLEQIFNQFASLQEEEKGGAVGMMGAGGAMDGGTGLLVEIQIPPGVAAGQQMAIETSVGQVLVEVPEGNLQTMQVQLPQGATLGAPTLPPVKGPSNSDSALSVDYSRASDVQEI